MKPSGVVRVERRLVANGLAHRVLCWQGDPARTVFLLHGYLDCADSLAAVGDALAAEGRRVFAPDFRGHGGSEWVPAGGYYHFADYVADLHGLVRALAPAHEAQTLSVVAHSMGGSVATLWCGAFPERVAAVVLLEGLGPPASPAGVSPDRMVRWLEGLAKFDRDEATGRDGRVPRRMASLDEVRTRLRVTHGSSVPDAVLDEAARWLTVAHPSGSGYAWRFDPLHQTTSPLRFDEAAYEHFARRVGAPTLLVDAGESGFHFDGVDARAAWWANARTVTLEGAGHMMHWTRPGELSALISSFLQEHGR